MPAKLGYLNALQTRHHLAIALLIALTRADTSAADEASRAFDPLRCKFTLPNAAWQWDDAASVSDAVCVAHSADGLKFILSVKQVPREMAISERFTRNVDKGAYAPGHMKKRGGRIITFKGLPCYESQALIDDSATAVIRYVVLDGFAYLLQLQGGRDPVEGRPDFEAVMGGFEITRTAAGSDRAQRQSVSGDDQDIFFRLGQATALCLMLAAIVGAAQWFFPSWGKLTGRAPAAQKADR